MKLIAAVLLSLCATAAHALDCLPTTAGTPLATGSQRLTVTTAAGDASAWWCLLPASAATAAGKVVYAPQIFTVLNKYRSATQFAAALVRISAAADPFAAASAEIAAATVVPVPGSQDEYDFNLLRFKACQALAAQPYIVPIDPLPPDWCGTAPVPPVVQWVVAPNPQSTAAPPTRPAFAVINGVRSLSSTARATVGAACDMSVTLVEGSSTYGQTAPGVVAICSKSP